MNRFRRKPAAAKTPSQQAPSSAPRKRRFGISRSTKRSLIALLVIALIIFLLFVTAPFWINWLWFGSMGYRSVLTTTYLAQGLSFFIAALIATLLFLVNMRLALRNTERHDTGEDGRFGRFGNRLISWLSLIGALILGFAAGQYFASRWEEVMLFLNGRSFGVQDPTFNRDVGFYVFQLPFLRSVEFALQALLAVTVIGVLIVYLVRMGVRFRSWGDVPTVALRHVTTLISASLLVMAVGYVLNNFELVYSHRGVVEGPGFTDTNIVRPINWLMALISAAVGIGLLFGYVMKNVKLFLGLLASWALLAFAITPLLAAGVQRFIVEPSEFPREQGYIANNISMTRSGFALDEVQMEDLSGQGEVHPAQIGPPAPTLDNVRVWDYRVVAPYYNQQQSFVSWYQFNDIDVDRYVINGETVQVLVGVRELNLDGLAQGRRTWTNQHLVYTHGYGYVISPVSQVSQESWPVQEVSGIPLAGDPALIVENPQVYFGESDLNWIILFTDQSEIGGLDDSGTSSEGFQGNAYGSVNIGNPVTRAMAALTLGDRNVFFTDQLNSGSRLVEHRNVVERARTIAPFLEYDPDPYMVVADGRMYWVIDAYTESNAYPHATTYDGRNYLRNSVKVVVDAYSGETTFYRTGVADPIADAWGSIYGGLFKPVSEVPAEIAAHFRYPEMQFVAQSEVWSDYHVDDARTWYDGDDRWAVAKETSEGDPQPMEPYFVNQVLPGDNDASFALTLPFTPGGNRTNENMTAWFAGTADESGATNLRLYRYPRQVTVFGPRQVEALINQDPDISQQITLWNQGGSRVIRGNMLVIPVGDGLLYVQPLYLQAAESTASAPRLARVIVSANGQVVMRPTLGEAIAALSDPGANTVGAIETNPQVATGQTDTTAGATPVASPTSAPTGTTTTAGTGEINRAILPADLASMSPEELNQEALDTLNRADAAQRDGDWDTYGKEMERLRLILEALAGGQGTPQATPMATPTN